jgi:hypothetical protein
MKRVIKSDKPVTLLLLFWSHKCDNGAEPRSRIIATSAVKGLKTCFLGHNVLNLSVHIIRLFSKGNSSGSYVDIKPITTL